MFEVLGLGFWVWGLGSGVWVLGFWAWGLEFGVWGLLFRIWEKGFEGQSAGFRQNLSCRGNRVQRLSYPFWGFGFGPKMEGETNNGDDLGCLARSQLIWSGKQCEPRLFFAS